MMGQLLQLDCHVLFGGSRMLIWARVRWDEQRIAYPEIETPRFADNTPRPDSIMGRSQVP